MNHREHDRPGSGAGDPGMEPLPAGYLPEPRPPAADPYWDAYTQRVMSALEPVLVAREESAAGVAKPLRRSSWTAELGDRWGATALLAAAGVAALVAVGIGERASEPPGPRTADVALALVAAGGDPALLWDRLDIAADPVLAWLAFEGVRP